MQNPTNRLVIERRVAFSQTDAAGLIHFSTYFVLMEEAEAELFRQLEISLLENSRDKLAGFPRVDCQCRFVAPLRFDDLVRIELTVDRIRTSGIHYAFRFFTVTGDLCAEGTMKTAYVDGQHGEKLTASPLPDSIRDRMQKWKNRPV